MAGVGACVTAANWAEDVHRFWFEELKPAAWFRSDPKVDETIRERFSGLLQALALSSTGAADARAAVAGAIVLDQFPRNIHRDSPAAYATDALALRWASDAIAAGFDRELGVLERQFLYMPFQHAEDRAAQSRSMELFTALGRPDAADSARRHKAVVDRFGRFPHRNAILGRTSTPAELEFLSAGKRF